MDDLNTATQNIAMAEAIFGYIKDYGFMHSSYFITDAVIEASKLYINNIGDYLDSRIMKVSHSFKTSTQHEIKSSRLRESPEYGEYGYSLCPLWVEESRVTDQVFEPDSTLQPMSMTYLDIPYLYTRTEQGYKFLDSVASADTELFSHAAVQILVDEQLSYWLYRNFAFFGAPLVFQLAVFWYWSNIVLPSIERDKDTFEAQDDVCMVILTIICVYFLLNEIPKAIKKRGDYFFSLTNITNLVSVLLILINIIDHKIEEASFWAVQSWSALTIWLRFFLYLRSVPLFSWLVRMIIACIRDMLTFMVVLIIGVFAFADAFQSLEKILVIEGLADEKEWPEE